MDKRHRELQRAIEPLGYRIVQGRKRQTHLTIRHKKTGHTLTVSASPRNSGHYIDNVLKDIRRYGQGAARC